MFVVRFPLAFPCIAVVGQGEEYSPTVGLIESFIHDSCHALRRVSKMATAAWYQSLPLASVYAQISKYSPTCRAVCNLNATSKTRYVRHTCNPRAMTLGIDECVGAAQLETNLCAAYPKESRSNEVKIIAIALSVITFPVVALRCISRWMITRRLWWDDWTAVVATVSGRHGRVWRETRG